MLETLNRKALKPFRKVSELVSNSPTHMISQTFLVDISQSHVHVAVI